MDLVKIARVWGQPVFGSHRIPLFSRVTPVVSPRSIPKWYPSCDVEQNGCPRGACWLHAGLSGSCGNWIAAAAVVVVSRRVSTNVLMHLSLPPSGHRHGLSSGRAVRSAISAAGLRLPLDPLEV